MQGTRIYEFDAVRGIVALLVALFHYTFFYNLSNPALHHAAKLLFVVDYGRNYVYLFLMLSGFFIMLSLEKKNTCIEFAVSRFSRLYPVYWASIIVTFVVIMLFGLPNKEVSFVEALINMTMLQGYLRVKTALGGIWILDRILMFYFIIFLIILFNKREHIKKILFIWISSILVIQLYNHFFHPVSLLFTELYRFLNVFLISNFIHHFAIGIILYGYYKKKKFEFVDILLMLFCYVLSYIMDGVTELIFALIFTMIAILIVKGKLSFLSNRIFAFLGKISYALFLIHQYIGFVIIRNLYLLNVNPNISVSISVIAAIMLAYLLTKYVEEPASKLIKQVYIALRTKLSPVIKI